MRNEKIIYICIATICIDIDRCTLYSEPYVKKKTVVSGVCTQTCQFGKMVEISLEKN